jgi:two-component system nitrogen regulation sensor histidine kinase GlnL
MGNRIVWTGPKPVLCPVPDPNARPNRMPDPNRMIASFPLAVLLLDPAMVVAAVNPAAEQLLGQSVRRLVNRPLEQVLVFDEPLIVSRLADAETHLVARKVRWSGRAKRARSM